MRAKCAIENISGGRQAIIVTEIPYQVNKSKLIERIAELVNEGVITDIARDGMMSGPNSALMRNLAKRYPAIALQASGGVAELADLATLRACGAARAIVGKAIWERRFTVAEGVANARG